MNSKTLALLFFIVTKLSAGTQLPFDIEKAGYEQYQDLYIRGQVVKKASYGERFMGQRFDIINSVLKRYSRPFTMLDVGAAQGYFCFRAAEMYPDSVFVMLEGSNPAYPKISEQLVSICNLNNHVKNVIWLNSPIVVDEMDRLSSCEHFDVVLALNIFHWFPDNWKQLFSALRNMSHILIVETPPIEDRATEEQIAKRKEIHQYLAPLAKETLQGVPRHTNPSAYTTYYILEKESPFELKRTTLLHPDYGDRDHHVRYTYDSKVFCKKDRMAPFATYETTWQPGINLLSYLMFNGAFPLRNEIVHLLPKDELHRDWMPNNMILQGKKLVLIDRDDDKNRDNANVYNKQLRKKVEKFLFRKGSKEVKRAFFSLLRSDKRR
jgi:hypothetical protein